MQIASQPKQLKNAVRAMLSAGLSQTVSVNRKELLHAVRRAQQALALSSSERVVLAELAATHQHERAEPPVVFPSNRWLETRCGCTERNIRIVIAKLESRGLIIRQDSANGKRYQRKKADGTVEAFGISLAPVIARRAEFERLIEAQKKRAREQADLHSAISVARKAVKEALEWLSSYPTVDTTLIRSSFDQLAADTPLRRGKSDTPSSLGTRWEELRVSAIELLTIANALPETEDAENQETPGFETGFQDIITANAGNNVRHKDKPESYLSNEVCRERFPAKRAAANFGLISPEVLPAIYVGEACPAIRDYGYPVVSTRDLITSADHFRALLGASRDTWDEGVQKLGEYGAAVAVAYTLQKYEDDVASGRQTIENPGAYLRSIIRKTESGDVRLLDAISNMRRKRIQ